MTIFSNDSQARFQEQLKRWGVLVSVGLAAIFLTFSLTRPAATPLSMTPLSGLMGLKTMATVSTPYEQAIANQNPTLIEFYADWCTTCQSMSATVETLYQQYGQQINFVMIDIDNPQWAEQITQYSATGVPQFTLLNSVNNTVETWVGKVPKPVIRQSLDQLL
ncbi:MAG: thioredoxin domain-containing protein [Cyanobacteria bacterium P01_D01_bin.105]